MNLRVLGTHAVILFSPCYAVATVRLRQVCSFGGYVFNTLKAASERVLEEESTVTLNMGNSAGRPFLGRFTRNHDLAATHAADDAKLKDSEGDVPIPMLGLEVILPDTPIPNTSIDENLTEIKMYQEPQSNNIAVESVTEIRPDKRMKVGESPLVEDKFRTPTKQRHIRRRLDGSPIVPADLNKPPKTVSLIRHGYSQGQAAAKNGLDRKTDKSLRDCNLTERGMEEAREIPTLFTKEELSAIQLVYSSPLTRALHTAVLGFPNNNIRVHFELREIGTKAPENIPRSMEYVLDDLHPSLEDRDENLFIDVETLRPRNWPRDHTPDVIRKERVRKFFQWLYKETEEINVVIVCHYNVIRAALSDEGNQVRPKNGKLIPCHLNSNGDLSLNLNRRDPSS